MDTSAGSEREHNYYQQFFGQYQRYSKQFLPILPLTHEDVYPDIHHTSFERSPPMVLDSPDTTPPSISQTPFTPGLEEPEESDSTSSNNTYCDDEDCEEKCGEDCDEDCDENCKEVPCDGNCDINNKEKNDCEDCVRYRGSLCQEQDCPQKDCVGCEPCAAECNGPEVVNCVVGRGPACYSTNCEISVPQACGFSTRSSSMSQSHSHSQSHSPYLNGDQSKMYQMEHGLLSEENFNFGFDVQPWEQNYEPEGRLLKRRRTEDMSSQFRDDQPRQTPVAFEPTHDHSSQAHVTSYPSNQDLYSCHWGDSCDMFFPDYFGLNNHVLQTHLLSQVDFTCQWDACGEAEKDLGQLLDHVKTSHTSTSSHGNGHVCLWQGCNASFANSEDLEHHLTTAHMPTSTSNGLLCQWEACGLQTDGLDGLTMHLHTDHFISPISEPQQQLSTTSSPSPSLSCTQAENDLICQWCPEEGGEPCGRQFTTAEALQLHAKDDHIAELRKKTGYFCLWKGCSRRDKQFSQKGKVERHMQTHTGFKSCRCPYCDKEFSAPQALQQHIRTHTGEKPYKCDICGKLFAQGSAMTMHKRVHTGERPLVCDFPGCNKRFSESSNLSKHRKTHNPVGQHRCPFPGCERSFHRLDQMKRHQRTHGAGLVMSPQQIAPLAQTPISQAAAGTEFVDEVPLRGLVQA